MFQSLSPSPLIHTIIEPHPSVLEHMTATGWTQEAKPNLRVLKGKWQDWVEEESGAIYEEGGFGELRRVHCFASSSCCSFNSID